MESHFNCVGYRLWKVMFSLAMFFASLSYANVILLAYQWANRWANLALSVTSFCSIINCITILHINAISTSPIISTTHGTLPEGRQLSVMTNIFFGYRLMAHFCSLLHQLHFFDNYEDCRLRARVAVSWFCLMVEKDYEWIPVMHHFVIITLCFSSKDGHGRWTFFINVRSWNRLYSIIYFKRKHNNQEKTESSWFIVYQN